jgi:hypothetical protein
MSFKFFFFSYRSFKCFYILNKTKAYDLYNSDRFGYSWIDFRKPNRTILTHLKLKMCDWQPENPQRPIRLNIFRFELFGLNWFTDPSDKYSYHCSSTSIYVSHGCGKSWDHWDNSDKKFIWCQRGSTYFIPSHFVETLLVPRVNYIPVLFHLFSVATPLTTFFFWVRNATHNFING